MLIGDFSEGLQGWQAVGVPPWATRSGVAFIDGEETDGIETWISKEVFVPFDGTLVFDARTDTEQTFDQLFLMIDRAQQQRWSGERPWARHRQSIKQGDRDIRFVYQKDRGTTRGSDVAEVDNIWLVRSDAECPIDPTPSDDGFR